MTRFNKRSRLSAVLLLAPLLSLGGCALFHGAAEKPAAATEGASPASTPAAPKPSTKGDPQQRFDAALKLMKTHQDDQAIAAFTALSKDFPKYSGPYTDLGILYARHKQWDLALQALGQATAANPHNAVAYDWMGIAYRNKGDYARAEQAYRSALKAKPDDANAHLDLAVLYDVYLKRPDAALTEYQAYRDAGHDDLIVQAWIKSLQRSGAKSQAPAAPASAMAPAATPKTLEGQR